METYLNERESQHQVRHSLKKTAKRENDARDQDSPKTEPSDGASSKRIEELISDNNDKAEIQARFQALKLRHEKINNLDSRLLEHVLGEGD
ncbi:hypothetical protein AVEN_239432-1 [Araneus ventricosus]|uniref:Uncharacterized protein n=1 Tax=Araneus ventricosus TaxID=182803 RepID=A0A4Y2X682_ARAVE|nr:hypothetical protein AVEN_239432-1 [Araneus ventricosus]